MTIHCQHCGRRKELCVVGWVDDLPAFVQAHSDRCLCRLPASTLEAALRQEPSALTLLAQHLGIVQVRLPLNRWLRRSLCLAIAHHYERQSDGKDV